jgi:hypothetical protein
MPAIVAQMMKLSDSSKITFGGGTPVAEADEDDDEEEESSLPIAF